MCYNTGADSDWRESNPQIPTRMTASKAVAFTVSPQSERAERRAGFGGQPPRRTWASDTLVPTLRTDWGRGFGGRFSMDCGCSLTWVLIQPALIRDRKRVSAGRALNGESRPASHASATNQLPSNNINCRRGITSCAFGSFPTLQPKFPFDSRTRVTGSYQTPRTLFQMRLVLVAMSSPS